MANDMRMPCSLMDGAPGYDTVGWVGQLMMDTASADGDVYKCVRIDGGKYVWIKIASGGGGASLEEIVAAVLAALPTWEGGSY